MGHHKLTGRALERTNLEFATDKRGEAGGTRGFGVFEGGCGTAQNLLRNGWGKG